MKIKITTTLAALALLPLGITRASAEPVSIPTEKDGWKTRNSHLEVVEKDGRQAFRLEAKSNYALAYVPNLSFKDGIIEAEMMTENEGQMFFGLAFRIQDEEVEGLKLEYNDTLKYEYIYFRPFQSGKDTAIQYCASGTKFNWQYLRNNFPGVYEGKADLPATDWFKVRIEIKDTVAKVYVNDQDTPSLTVTDLKLGDGSGSVGIFSYSQTAYFANIRVESEGTSESPQ